jgi:hypothetical protein
VGLSRTDVSKESVASILRAGKSASVLTPSYIPEGGKLRNVSVCKGSQQEATRSHQGH